MIKKIILAVALLWAGWATAAMAVAYWDVDLSSTPVVAQASPTVHTPVKNCFVSNDGDYLICRINTGDK